MYADGYKYWFAFKTDKTSYYRCCRYIRSKCPGKCTNEDGLIKQHNTHNHPPESNRILVDKFRKILTQRSCTENTELYTIYCDEATNRHTDAALLYPFTSAESAMRKARRKQLPCIIPKTIDDIINELDNTDLFRVNSGNDRDPLYQKTIQLNDNSICMIFLHRKTINILERIDELHIDGSFEFIIENQPNYYLLTFHAIIQHGQLNVPIVYAIITSKIKSSYIAIFTYIRDELKIQPNIIISDYDIIMQSSIKYIYPDTILKGCWFHYTDAILSQVKNLNIKSELQRGNGASSLRMLLVLPLLPPEYMVPGLNSIRKWMNEKTIYSKNLEILCNYIEYSWLKLFGTEKMSIFGTTRIASNHLKNFNRELSDLIGKQNPIIWVILDSLTQLATKIYVKTTRKLRFLKQTINTQNMKLINNNNDNNVNNYKQTTTTSSIKCAPTINSFDLTKQTQLILPIPRTMKRSELVSETIITSATQLWIKTPVHLRNSLQFLQLISHCINDSMYLANLSDIKERNYLPSIASIDNLKLAINSTKNSIENNTHIINNNNSNNSINNSDQEISQNIIMQSFILDDENMLNSSNNSNNCNNTRNTNIIEMIENNHNNNDGTIITTTNHWNNTNQLNDLQQSPSSPTLSFVLQEGTFNCTEITHQEYLLAQPGQSQQQNIYTSCFAQNNYNIDDLNNHHHQHHEHNTTTMNNLQDKNQIIDCQQSNVFNFNNNHNHQHLQHHIDINNINSVEIRPMHQQQSQQQIQQQQQLEQLQQEQQQQQQEQQKQVNPPLTSIQQTEPPPLVFFKSVKRYPLKRILPVLSDPPPLVPINSAKRSLITNKSNSKK